MSMKSIRLTLLATVSIAAVSGLPAAAQQTTGTPGSPGATTTIDGKYLPPPPPKFGGDINLQASQSKPYWPARVVPPQGAPNVLLIMLDDMGFGVSTAFGGPCSVPTAEALAVEGLRYSRFHTTSICAPPGCGLSCAIRPISVCCPLAAGPAAAGTAGSPVSPALPGRIPRKWLQKSSRDLFALDISEAFVCRSVT